MVCGARKEYCSIEGPFSVTTPSMTVRMEMTMATLGRRMKNWAMGYRYSGPFPRSVFTQR
jgi:hypothetical protein